MSSGVGTTETGSNPGPSSGDSGAKGLDENSQVQNIPLPDEEENLINELNRLIMYEEHDGVDQFLNQHPTLNLNSPKGDNLPLHRACLTSSVTRTLKRLLEAGASPDARCSYISQDARFNYTDGYNAIQCMMVNGGPMKSDVVECLKEKSINPETYLTLRDEKVKATPLQLAVELGHIEGVQLLVEAGTYKTLTDAEKRDLVRSAGGSNLEIVKYLLENEPVSILNDASNDGAQSCLGKAILWNRTDIVQWLLERGADPNIKVESESETAKGVVEKRTPWDLALKNTYFELCGVLSLMEWKNSFIEMSDISEADELVDHTKEYDQNSWWFNIEGNNATAIYGLLRKISKTSEPFQYALDLDQIIPHIDASFRLERDQEDPIGCKEAGCVFENIDEISNSFGYSSVVMPFLYTDSIGSITNREKKYEKIKKVKYCASANTNSLGIQLTPTMDEYCKSSLAKPLLDDRNGDQVLLRYEKLKYKIKGEKLEDMDPSTPARLLTVPQIWIWTIADKVITAMPEGFRAERWPNRKTWMYTGSIEGLLAPDPRQDQQQENQNPEASDSDDNKGPAYQKILKVRAMLVGLIISDCVDTLNRPCMAGHNEPIFSVFESSISEVYERVSIYADKAEVSNINLKEEKAFLHDITDIQEELSLIKSVLFEQEEVWREYTYEKFPECWPNGPTDRFIIPHGLESADLWVMKMLQRPQTQFAKYKRQIEKLEDDSNRVKDNIHDLLDLKSKVAGLKETHLTTVMSASVIGFTIITVIFTPLSFAAAVFALKPVEFPADFTTNYLGKWMATTEIASLCVTGLAIWFAIELITEFPTTNWVKRTFGFSPKKGDTKIPPVSAAMKRGETKSAVKAASKPVFESKEAQQPNGEKSAWRGSRVQSDEENQI